MRIALITTDRKPGGIAVAIVNYVESLLALGHEVELVIPQSASFLREQLTLNYGQQISFINLSRLDLVKIRRLRRIPTRISRMIDKKDLVISQNNFLCLALKRSVKCPVLSICHSDKSKGLHHADFVIALSQAASQKLIAEGIGPDKTFTLPHYYKARSSQNAYLQSRQQLFIVAAAGRLVEKKGFTDYLKAAGRLHQRYPDLVFWLAGTGKEEKKLRAFAQENQIPVHFKGWMNIEDLAHQAAIFCLTSKSEPFGYVLCEMMDFGVPCISTKSNGPLTILGEEPAGLLYPSGRDDLLADAIIQLYEKETLRRELSKKAFERIREADFAKETFTKRLSLILEKSAGL